MNQIAAKQLDMLQEVLAERSVPCIEEFVRNNAQRSAALFNS